MDGSIVHGELASEIGETNEISWTAPRNLSLDQWLAVGRTLQQVGRSLNFWIGDWLAFGERKYGESYAQGVELTGAAVESLKKYKAVAERIPPEIRLAELTWSHHFAVCYTDPAQRGPLLDLASRFDLGVRDLQRVVALPEAGRERVLELAANGLERSQLDALVQKALLETAPMELPPELPGDPPYTDRMEKDDGDEWDGELWEEADDSVQQLWRKKGVPLVYRDGDSAAWPGIRCMAVLDDDGSPILRWEIDPYYDTE